MFHMQDCYPYFISSLPFLQLGMKPPFAFNKFIEICGEYVPAADIGFIESVADTDALAVPTAQTTLAKWRSFETALRNELVRIRSARKRSGERYIRGDGYTDPPVAAEAIKAHRAASATDSEWILDTERWRALDDMEAGHYFDIDFLIVYAIRLLILEKWEEVRKADGSALVEEVLSKETA